MQITPKDVRDRAQVHRLAPVDPESALELACAIVHPWYRCQSLAAVAEHLQGRKRPDVLAKAFAAAKAQHEPNRIVTVAGWPVRVMADADPVTASQWIAELVTIAGTEPHNLRRANALQSLAHMTSPHPDLMQPVIPALVEAVLGGCERRIDRVIRDTWKLVRSTHPELLRAYALHHKANRQQQRLLDSIAEAGSSS